MTQVSPLFQTPFEFIARYWNCWKATCDRAITHYYNQRIELNPEGEAYHYWNRLQHPRFGIAVEEINDRMLSRLMDSLLEQGISKFAVDRFILALRRYVRTAQATRLLFPDR